MLDNSYRCVIDADGYYVTLVLLIEQPDGSTALYAYTLGSGETLIDASPPSNLIKPRWTGSEWTEGATEEEIVAWEQEHPTPPSPDPTPEQRITQLEALDAVKQQQIDDLSILVLQLGGALLG